MSREQANLFFQIVARRYHKALDEKIEYGWGIQGSARQNTPWG